MPRELLSTATSPPLLDFSDIGLPARTSSGDAVFSKKDSVLTSLVNDSQLRVPGLKLFPGLQIWYPAAIEGCCWDVLLASQT